MFFTSAAEVNS